jgi:hypothetical protein
VRLIREQSVGLDAFDDIYEASFWFSFKLIFKRDCVNIVRGSWKLGVLLLQVVMKILLLGVFFLNEMPSVEQVATSYFPNLEFFRAQSACFNTIGGSIIPAIISVALTSTSPLTQSRQNESSTTSRQTRRSTSRCPTTFRRLSSRCCW